MLHKATIGSLDAWRPIPSSPNVKEINARQLRMLASCVRPDNITPCYEVASAGCFTAVRAGRLLTFAWCEFRLTYLNVKAASVCFTARINKHSFNCVGAVINSVWWPLLATSKNRFHTRNLLCTIICTKLNTANCHSDTLLPPHSR